MNVSMDSSTAPASARPVLLISRNALQGPPVSVGPARQPESAAASEGAEPGTVAKHLDEAVGAINAFLKPISNNLEFSVDEGSGKTIVKLVDTETNTVLRQYPTKEALAIAKDIDRFRGLLVNTEA